MYVYMCVCVCVCVSAKSHKDPSCVPIYFYVTQSQAHILLSFVQIQTL